MKRHLFLSVLVLALIATLLLAAGPVAAKATKTYFTGTETLVEDISAGREWVTADKIYHVREAVSRFEVVVDDPRVSGYDTITLNLNMEFVPDPVILTGRMWGTFRIDNEDGYWEGTFTGVRDERGFSYIKMVGSGGEGYAGLQIRIDIERETPDWTQAETLTGYILDPGQ